MSKWREISKSRRFSRSGFQTQIRDLLEDNSDLANGANEKGEKGLLIVDHRGVVVHLNQAGHVMLGIPPRMATGEHIAELLDFRPVILDTIERGRGFHQKPFTFDSPTLGKLSFRKSATVLFDRAGEVAGVVDAFRCAPPNTKGEKHDDGIHSHFSFRDLLGHDPSFLEAVDLGRKSAQSDATVLLEGESGTGKEMFAHAIHNDSRRRDGPFVIVNCACLPGELIESELFGYVSGSFTGARREGHYGKFEVANNGSVFLDEIGEMGMGTQAKLLRVLQDKSFTPVGGSRPVVADVRIIAATNKQLSDAVNAGTFREDLYYRLNVLRIRMPALRERKTDIVWLAQQFFESIAREHKRSVPKVDARVFEILANYNWPGNVRELRNIIERIMIWNPTGIIEAKHLPDELSEAARGTESRSGSTSRLEETMRMQIERSLRQNAGNISATAKDLGISRNTLYRKLRMYRVPQQEGTPRPVADSL